MDYVWTISVLIITFCGGWLVGFKQGKQSNRSPYGWDCLQEGCDFHVSTTNPDLTLQLADVHLASSHPQGY